MTERVKRSAKWEHDLELGVESSDDDEPKLKSKSSLQEENGELEDVRESTPLERAAGGLALVAVASSVGAMIVQPTALIFTTSFLSGAIGTLTYHQQTELTDLRHVIETSENLTKEIDELQKNNLRLTTTTLELSCTVDRLQELEESFEAISSTESKSVKEFERQIHVNKSVLKRSHINLKGKVLQNLLSVVTSAANSSEHVSLEHKIEKKEMDKLIRKLHNIAGLQVHDDRLEAMIQARNFGELLKVARNLISDDVPEEDIIFEVDSSME